MGSTTEKKVIYTVILPALTNGAVTWSFAIHQTGKTVVTQRIMERRYHKKRYRKVQDAILHVTETKGDWERYLYRLLLENETNYNKRDS